MAVYIFLPSRQKYIIILSCALCVSAVRYYNFSCHFFQHYPAKGLTPMTKALFYLPIQKVLNILSRISSVVTIPVISPRLSRVSLSSIENNSRG